MKINNEISPGMCVLSESDTTVSIMAPFDNANPGNFVMEWKKCGKCSRNKPITEYYKGKMYKGGHLNQCKTCCGDQRLLRRRTKDGIIHTIYYDQQKSSREYILKSISYTKNELKEWCLSQSIFHKLYDKWVESNYDKYMKPSIDRINDYKGYSFGNIQLMTWQENKYKGYRDIKNGINRKNYRPILKCDKFCNVIEEYDSVKKAAENNNISATSIIYKCQGKRIQTNNIVFKYKN